MRLITSRVKHSTWSIQMRSTPFYSAIFNHDFFGGKVNRVLQIELRWTSNASPNIAHHLETSSSSGIESIISFRIIKDNSKQVFSTLIHTRSSSAQRLRPEHRPFINRNNRQWLCLFLSTYTANKNIIFFINGVARLHLVYWVCNFSSSEIPPPPPLRQYVLFVPFSLSMAKIQLPRPIVSTIWLSRNLNIILSVCWDAANSQASLFPTVRIFHFHCSIRRARGKSHKLPNAI